MVLLLVVLLSIALAFEAKTSSVEFRPSFVRDANGNQHMVNPNPYSVVDAHLEPRFTAETDIIFKLHTRNNPDEAQILKLNDTNSVTSSNFNAKHPTRFVIHGWNQNGESDTLVTIRKSYLSVGDFNVIGVDWGIGAQTINYITARYLVESVGRVTSQMIDTLVKAAGISPNSVNVIGHSLGAHAAGNVGKFQHGLLNTIVGLDPAGPLFTADSSDVLSRQDAQYVETVCTNAGLLGFYRPLGDGNFYPNGGAMQPGCGFDFFGKCAHSRSWMYFAESITSSFQARQCISFEELVTTKCSTSTSTGVTMGGEPSNHGQPVEGIYIVDTNAQAPFAKG